MTTTNASPKAAALAQRRRAISTPITASSEGHASAVRIQRQVGERTTGLWAEGVPFRVLSQPRRVQPSTTAEPLLMRTGCATSGACMGHPDCADTQCEGHPDNTALARTPQGAELRELQDGYQVPPSERDPAAAALFWRVYIGGIVAALALITQADRIVGWLLG